MTQNNAAHSPTTCITCRKLARPPRVPRPGERRLLQDRKTTVIVTVVSDGNVGWLADDGTWGRTPLRIFAATTAPML